MSDYYISNLLFKGFRCFQHAKLNPINGVNILTGADDVGKSTLLYGTALLLSRDPSIVLMETDYNGLKVEDKFEISATITCVDYDLNSSKEFKISVKGSEELKLEFSKPESKSMQDSEMNAILDSLSCTRIISNRFTNQETKVTTGAMGNSPENTEQAQIQSAKLNLLNTAVSTPISNQPVSMEELQAAFTNNSRPSLSIESPSEMVDSTKLARLKLIEARTGVSIPMSSWGGGTKVATQQLHAGFSQVPDSICLIDEFAVNMDYVAQQIMLENLSKLSTQAFIVATTPAIFKSSANHAIIVVSPNDRIGKVQGNRVDELTTSQPSAFFAKKIIIGEGATEVGFHIGLASLILGKPPINSGLFMCDGQGCDSALALANQWFSDGQVGGVFVDNESNIDPKTLVRLKNQLQDLFFQWKEGSLESNFIQALPTKHLKEFISHPVIGPNQRLRTIADRIGYSKDEELSLENLIAYIGSFKELQSKDEDQKTVAVYKKFYQIMEEATLGIVPDGTPVENIGEFKGHKSQWFKSLLGGFELALKLDSCGVWKNGLREPLLPFINAYLEECGFPKISDLPSSPHNIDDILATYLSRKD